MMIRTPASWPRTVQPNRLPDALAVGSVSRGDTDSTVKVFHRPGRTRVAGADVGRLPRMGETSRSWPDDWGIDDFLQEQSGVVSRLQLIGGGETTASIRRLIRRRELAVVHPGIYVNHTGDPTWLQRSWAAVLHAWPAALSGESALRSHEGPGKLRRDVTTVEVVVDLTRTVVAPRGIRVRRIDRLSERVMWNTGPPRLRYEDAAIDVACRAQTELDTLSTLADIVQSRRSTAARLAAEVASRTRVPRRDWMRGVLTDIADGTCSVLEHGYLHRVVRDHGLPGGVRQVRDGDGTRVVYRDTEHDNGLVVELDGRLFHDTASQRDADMERDLDAAVSGKDTVRLGWGQVFERGCRTAAKVAALHRARGWTGAAHPCGRADCGIGVT